MSGNETLPVTFEPSRQSACPSLEGLTRAAITFLGEFATPAIVGRAFHEIVGDGSGRKRFQNLLDACGCDGDRRRFFESLLPLLARASHEREEPITVGGVLLPTPFLLAILEVLLPGNKVLDVRTVRQYEKAANVKVPAEEREDLQEVLDNYPVRFSMHTLRQMRLSPAIAYQYAPFVGELDRDGQSHTWVGQFHRGVLEQMYRNRLIFVLNMKCPVYCRFCFRKHKECRNQKSPTQAHVQQALAYIREAPDIKEVVLTGGDPFMNRPTFGRAIDGLRNIPHVKTIRCATRSLSYYPHLFRKDHGRWLKYLERRNLELSEKGKRLEVATHFIHPDELSLESLEIIGELVSHGIPVYVQTPLLERCNDTGSELVELFGRLRSVGAEIHYIFMPCSPILGNKRYWAPISRGLAVARHLRHHLSDRAVPHITTATAIGKVDWNTSGWAVERCEKDPKYLWIRTPYTPEYFEPFAPIMQVNDVVRLNEEGTFDCRFMAEIGDDSLLAGKREVRVTGTGDSRREFEAESFLDESLEQLRHHGLRDQRETFSLASKSCPKLWRVHLTRVEVDACASDEERDAILRSIRQDSRITDVVLASRRDLMDDPYDYLRFVEALHEIPHVRAVRLRSLKLVHEPGRFSSSLVRKLARYNHLEPAAPLRLEIETSFLHERQFAREHEHVCDVLRNHGISVYVNTPLLDQINATGPDIMAIANACRRCGMEYNTVYLCGLSIHEEWASRHPFEISRLVDVASHVRLMGSGREIPQYVLRTPLGDVDYGISSEIVGKDETGRVLVKHVGCDSKHFASLGRELGEGEFATADDGSIIVPVEGLGMVTTIDHPV